MNLSICNKLVRPISPELLCSEPSATAASRCLSAEVNLWLRVTLHFKGFRPRWRSWMRWMRFLTKRATRQRHSLATWTPLPIRGEYLQRRDYSLTSYLNEPYRRSYTSYQPEGACTVRSGEAGRTKRSCCTSISGGYNPGVLP